MERVWRCTGPLDLRRTLAPLAHARSDPTQRTAADGAVWRTTLTPDGPATCRIVQTGQDVRGEAWGAGASWVLEVLPDLCGAGDSTEFVPDHPLLARTQQRYPGVRVPRSLRVFESLVPAVLEQKVTGKQARESFLRLVRRYGGQPPGPAPEGMRVPPAPETWARIPSWEWHRAGVDPRRMRTVMAAAEVAGRLEEAATTSAADARARLTAVPGIGEWTYAEVAVRALGDTDAVSVGDFHLSRLVGWALLGSALDDDGMLALLEKWRPHRAKAVRLIELSGVSAPRFGPRLTIQDHRGH